MYVLKVTRKKHLSIYQAKSSRMIEFDALTHFGQNYLSLNLVIIYMLTISYISETLTI